MVLASIRPPVARRSSAGRTRRFAPAIALAVALAAVLACGEPGPAEGFLLPDVARAATTSNGGATSVDSATLLQCQTSGEASERSATFAGEMSAIPGATRLSMRIELLERPAGEPRFHVVSAPGLGVWRTADPGVGVYRYVKQVTNLAAPADYRGLVTFRWQGARGRTFKREERRTRPCSEPTLPDAQPTGSSTSSGSTSPGTLPPSSAPAVE